ncbi:MAG: AAA family ATPase [Alphaproteobacteria bacterium]|nr:AAA family ATPase [Alphaproteobacteria bacterium]
MSATRRTAKKQPRRAAPAPGGVRALEVEALAWRCDPALVGCTNSSELPEVEAPVGQERALNAVAFAADIAQGGFNAFVMGPAGSGKHTAVRALLEDRAARRPAPCDWAYVYNFADPLRPRVLHLDSGTGLRLRDGMRQLIDDLKTSLPAIFESDEYRQRRQTLEQTFVAEQEAVIEELRKAAAERGLALVNTQNGPTFAAVKDNAIVTPEAFNALPEEERAAIIKAIEEMQARLGEHMFRLPRAQRRRRDAIRALNQDVAAVAVRGVIDDLTEVFAAHTDANEFLSQVEKDLVENVHFFLPSGEEEEGAATAAARIGPLRRYEVNVIVTNDPAKGAPLIEEVHPTLSNLVGRIEHVAQMGALVSDFTLIRAGALHRANGGILMIDARRVLSQPFAWEALKRALRAGEIRIDHPADGAMMISTVTLSPDPIPLDVKIILFGEREIFLLLAQADPDFADHFKVQADFSETVARDEAAVRALAAQIATIARRSKTRSLDAPALARLIEHAARLSGEGDRLLVMVTPLADLVREADHLAANAGAAMVAAEHVTAAIEQQIHRANRVRERQQEAILEEKFLIATQGEAIGQINGLSVTGFGGISFGRPTRITASVGPGAGEVVDIEREVALGGPIHSKGMLILQGYLRARFATTRPLSLRASLVFEQSYGGVDGDSASAAELLTLLSAIAEVPLRQDLAITGSVNQHGAIQVIGGANEKIEGFFDICAKRGLTGRQGVAIPIGNVSSLMLRADVIEAARRRQFHIYPLSTIDEAIRLFTGLLAGTTRTAAFARGSFSEKVAKRLDSFWKLRMAANGPRRRRKG